MANKGSFPSTTDGVLGAPLRNLIIMLILVAVVFLTATAGYIAAEWSISDSTYMVTLTIFSVGYDEVHPINTVFLCTLTTATIVLRCTGMIVMTGALVQVFTVYQLRRILGVDCMHTQIDGLQTHVIICGFGRIGVQIANERQAPGTGFVIIKRDQVKIAEADSDDFLFITADATEESALRMVRIERANTRYRVTR